VITVLGGSLPVFTFGLSFLFLNERLAQNQLMAVLLLIVGIIVMGWERKKASKGGSRFVIYSLAAGLCYAVSFVGSKYVFDHQAFVSGFFWMRVGGFLAGLSLLLHPVWRREIVSDLKSPAKEQKTSKGLVLINQTIGAAGFVLLNIAISRGSATIVNALQGVQYAFIFLLAVILGKKIPQLKEEYSRNILLQKLLAIILIGAGLAVLSL
jgi:drug/metabolite transporter (DMT)-like permease